MDVGKVDRKGRCDEIVVTVFGGRRGGRLSTLVENNEYDGIVVVVVLFRHLLPSSVQLPYFSSPTSLDFLPIPLQ